MADEKKDEKAGGADASLKPTGKSKIGHTAERFGVQALNRFKKPLARLIVSNLPLDLKAKIMAHQDAVETVSTLIATLPPNQGILGHLTDDLQQGVVNEVIEQIKAEQAGSTATPSSSHKPAFEEAKEIRRIMLTVAALPDQAKRDNFNFWFKGLPEGQWKTFLALTAASNDNELKALVQMPVPELETLLAALPSAPQEKKPMTYLEFQQAVQNDAMGLGQQVQDFLTSYLNLDPEKFWKAAFRKCGSVEEVRRLFEVVMTDKAIAAHLGIDLDPKPIGTRLADNVTSSGMLNAAEKFRDTTKGFFDKALARL